MEAQYVNEAGKKAPLIFFLQDTYYMEGYELDKRVTVDQLNLNGTIHSISFFSQSQGEQAEGREDMLASPSNREFTKKIFLDSNTDLFAEKHYDDYKFYAVMASLQFNSDNYAIFHPATGERFDLEILYDGFHSVC